MSDVGGDSLHCRRPRSIKECAQLTRRARMRQHALMGKVGASTREQTSGPLQASREAGILKWSELTVGQKQAARQALALLASMAVLPAHDLNRLHTLVPIEPARYNCVLLLEAGRGAGKTALLLSLLDALQSYKSPRFTRGNTAEPCRDWQIEVGSALGDARVIPIALVDMVPLPPNTNFLLHIVSCMEAVVREVESKHPDQHGEDKPRPPWLSEDAKELRCREMWRSLASSIVEGWDATRGRLQGNPDLESYTSEQMAAEEQRHRLPLAIDAFLDALKKDYVVATKFQNPDTRNPEEPSLLFLLAVDDADLAPERTRALLDALRLFGHHRLAFILTGESRQLLQALEGVCMDLMCGPVKPGMLPSADVTARWSASVQLARQVYDKLIPAPHRCEIPQMSGEERLKFSLLQEKTEATASLPSASLHDLLRKHSQAARSELAEALQLLPWLCDALPSTPRALAHWLLLLQRHHMKADAASSSTGASTAEDSDRSQHAAQKVLHALVHELWIQSTKARGLIDAEKNLGTMELSSYDQTLRCDVSTTLAEQPLVRRQQGTASLLKTSRSSQNNLTAGQVSMWAARISFVMFTAELAPNYLRSDEGSAAAAMCLGCILGYEAGENGLIVTPSLHTGLTPLLAGTELRLSQGASLNAELARPLQLGWPLPESLALPQLLWLLLQWQRKADRENLSPDQALEPFLAAVCTLAARSSAYEGLDDAGIQGLPLVYRKIGRIAHAREGVVPESLRTWAYGRAALLSAPESGLTAECANQLLGALQQAIGPDLWAVAREDLRQSRRQRIIQGMQRSAPTEVQANQLCVQIDSVYGQYHWALTIERNLADEAAALLLQVPLRVAPQAMRLLERASVKWLQELGNLVTQKRERTDFTVTHFLTELMASTTKADAYGFSVSLPSQSPALTSEATPQSSSKRAEYVGQELISRMPGPLFSCVALSARLPFFDSSLRQGESGTELQQVVRQLYWDQMSSKQEGLPLFPFADWPASATCIPLQGLMMMMPWPGPRWRTYQGAGRAAAHWNQVLAAVGTNPSIPRSDATIEALAYFHLCLCFAVLKDAALLPVFPDKPPSEQAWVELFRSESLQLPTEAASKTQPSLEAAAHTEFWNNLPLMMAPESGLPMRAVRAIMRFYSPPEGMSEKVVKLLVAVDAVRVERMERVATQTSSFSDGNSMGQALAALVDSAARNIEHPYSTLLSGLKRNRGQLASSSGR